jgi:hypothetical protein
MPLITVIQSIVLIIISVSPTELYIAYSLSTLRGRYYYYHSHFTDERKKLGGEVEMILSSEEYGRAEPTGLNSDSKSSVFHDSSHGRLRYS